EAALLVGERLDDAVVRARRRAVALEPHRRVHPRELGACAAHEPDGVNAQLAEGGPTRVDTVSAALDRIGPRRTKREVRRASERREVEADGRLRSGSG